ncbi:hypothetical protein [Rhodanobacter sp. T12-5]|uniref:hypothetical protein n=1 Tax=Rhodanobacter sp. T12-5 TaxID=2024611 RepID=UPI0011EDD25F|nr:hypothetical protein [Rhodanobacter sp. T12-5]KAA0068602.1 hypothetical protein CIW53_15055 [Rhodanobacter sp. T12-5]
MAYDNRVDAVLSDEDVTTIQTALTSIRGVLPFLVTLSGQERRELAKMGPKSVGFDEKCATYMNNRPEFAPGFVDVAEVQKVRALRSQLLRFTMELQTLSSCADDTLQLVSSEVWLADLDYYKGVREAAKTGQAGAQDAYDDLRVRFPGPRGNRTAPASVAA